LAETYSTPTAHAQRLGHLQREVAREIPVRRLFRPIQHDVGHAQRRVAETAGARVDQFAGRGAEPGGQGLLLLDQHGGGLYGSGFLRTDSKVIVASQQSNRYSCTCLLHPPPEGGFSPNPKGSGFFFA
jgi:hypothetical protein